MTFGDLTIATLKKWSKTLADNVSGNNALLAKLKEKGAIIQEDGGTALEEGIDAQENSTFKWYDGYEVLDISPSEVLSSAVFAWKQASAVVSISGKEVRNNKGSQTKKYNLLASKMTNCERTMKNKVSLAVFSDGTGSNGKELGGLQLLISDTPSAGVVGGIDAGENEFWRNQLYSFNSEASITSDPKPEEMLEAMSQLWLRTVRNSDKPDLIIADAKYFSIYEKACTSIKRINDSAKIGDASFPALDYKGVPVIYDSNCPEKHMYFINTDFLKLRVHEDAYFSLDEERITVNQDARVYPMLFQGNLTCSNRNLQGVIKA